MGKRNVRRIALFHLEFLEDLRHWVKSDRGTAIRVLDLVEAVLRDPFQGTGKPEPLQYLLAGCWSRESPVDSGNQTQVLHRSLGADVAELDPHIITGLPELNVASAPSMPRNSPRPSPSASNSIQATSTPPSSA